MVRIFGRGFTFFLLYFVFFCLDFFIFHTRGKNKKKIGKNVVGFLPQTKFILLFGPLTSVQYFMKVK